MLLAVVQGIAREGLPVARAQVLVLYKLDRNIRRRRQQQRIEVDVLGVGLPLANDRDFLFDDVTRRHRIGRNEQDEDVARAQLALDFLAPVRAAGHQSVAPYFDRALPLGRPQIAGHERSHLTSPSAGFSGSSAWA